MKHRGTCVLIVMLVIGLIVAALPACSQEVTAAITGTVLDPSGAPIKGATVTAKDTDRGTTWTSQTSDSGVFNIVRIPVGSYAVTATAPGFETAHYPPFTLVLNQTARLEFQMKVGQVTETVEVAGTAPVLKTETTEVDTVIDT